MPNPNTTPNTETQEATPTPAPVIHTCSFCHETIGNGTGRRLYRASDIQPGNRNVYCGPHFQRHFPQCAACGERHPVNDMVRTTGGSLFCNDCASDRVFYCDHCGQAFDTRTHRPNDYNGGLYCAVCYEEIASEISPYSYKPNPLFRTIDHTGKLVRLPRVRNIEAAGMEIELEHTGSVNLSEHAGNLQRLVNTTGKHSHIYCKRDGSLCNGFEIVTHPLTREAIYSKAGRDLLAQILSIKDKGFIAATSPNCGFHVHVNRKALSYMELYKVIRLIHKGFNPQLLVKICQREKVQNLASFASLSLSQGMINITRNGSQNRYTAINVTQNTIEFRIFKGNLRFDRIMKNLDFVFAVIDYCRISSIPDLTTDKFMAYTKANPKKYTYLNKYYTERRI